MNPLGLNPPIYKKNTYIFNRRFLARLIYFLELLYFTIKRSLILSKSIKLTALLMQKTSLAIKYNQYQKMKICELCKFFPNLCNFF